MKFFVALAAAGALAVPAAAVNLVTNGSFEAGNTGFTSQYAYQPSAPSAGLPEGVYLIDTNAANVHPFWANVNAPSGSGNYLIVNGSTSEVAGESRVVWEQTLNAAANTKYFFEAFATNICCNASFTGSIAPSNLTFEIQEGALVTTLDTFNTGSTPTGTWQALSSNYTTSVGGPVTLRIFNSNLAASGNDFGVDDISFSTSSVIPEPATWAMMILGFGLVGFAARRRAAVAA